MPNFAIQNTVVTGVKTTVPGSNTFVDDLTKYLNTLPTLTVGGSSAAKSVSLSLTGFQCVNFIGGIGSAILQSATLGGLNTVYLFFNTGGAAAAVVNLKLDNGGTIGGQSVFSLVSGQPARFAFDGTNLN